MPALPARNPRKHIRTRKDWYSISVDTLRGFGMLLLILAALALGYLGFRELERRALERESRLVMEEDQRLLARVRGDVKAGDYRSEYEAGAQSLQQAGLEYQRRNFRAALASANTSKKLLQSILDALDLTSTGGQARVVSLQGEVEYKRADQANWEEAHNRTPLRAGDYVRTGNGGSAEIVFLDGTLYTVRADTELIVAPGGARGAAPAAGGASGAADQSIQMAYGWVNLNTSSRPSQVSTPGVVARVRQDSEAFVAFDKQSNRGRFGAYRGGMELAAKGGMTRNVQALQQVVQTGDLLSEPQRLPAQPEPFEPADNRELDLDRSPSLVLTWSAVPDSARYALQVSRNQLFADNLISVENRVRPRATLGLRGEGIFYWRVAAVGRDGNAGPWSRPRKFRVASYHGGGERPKVPPELDLDDVKSYGSIFIVAGRSNPGARIQVNGEQVNVGIDGSFKKTVQLTKEGWSSIEIRARDRWGNETVRRCRVFVEGT
ncbi:MAG TPA: FecR domain-containing protein [Thermoanaerobaculia bacterium]|nr:FecR domain-containing protein [Thermoanaerobaculia bacterium]